MSDDRARVEFKVLGFPQKKVTVTKCKVFFFKHLLGDWNFYEHVGHGTSLKIDDPSI